MVPSKDIRNIAIIAHIDHGKTTLLDALLKQSNIFRDNELVPERVLDSYEQERERGITIFAKHTSIYFEHYKINIVDTPGHADFSGEVERVLGLVNGVLLLVDATDGPMPQTRFVLSQALKKGLRPIVVINKIDRPNANVSAALDATFDLFVELGANDDQLDFPICYCSGIEGYAVKNLDDVKNDMRPLFQFIIDCVEAPPGDINQPFLMQATTLKYNNFVGRQACGRILQGSIKKNDNIIHIDNDNKATPCKVQRVDGFLGLEQVELEEAGVGDIVIISGIPEVMIGDTLCSPQNVVQLPPITLSDPTISVSMSVNDGPLVGREGKNVTINKIRERLLKEQRANISLKFGEIESNEDTIEIYGKGELHLSILFEAMRREGFEFCISKPKVITKLEGETIMEPQELVHVEVQEEYSGPVLEELSKRKGIMQSLIKNEQNIVTMEFLVPTRGMMGYRSEFIMVTRGNGILTSVFDSYTEWRGEIPLNRRGSLISISDGKATAYAIFALQERGTIFVSPGDDIYEGMIVGENSREDDMMVNITKAKHLTNVRAAGSDEKLILIPPRVFTLEQAIDYIGDADLIEITPKSIRLRKKFLKELDRKRAKK